MASEKTEGLEVVAYRKRETWGAWTYGDGPATVCEQGLVLESDAQLAIERAREEGRVQGQREVYSLVKRMLSRHVSNEGRTVLGQLCGKLKSRWPGIDRRTPSPPPEREG